MRRATLYLLLFAVSLTSSGAQEKAAPSVTTQDSTKATVYIYRYKQFVGAALAPSVYCDDVQLARMENGRYFATTVEPGATEEAASAKVKGKRELRCLF